MRISDWSSDVCSSDLLQRSDTRSPRLRIRERVMAYEHPTRVGASRPNRRDLLTTTMLLGTGLLSGCTTVAAGGASAGAIRGEALIDDVAHRTFRFFWDTTNPANGLAPDRYPSKSFSTIAAVWVPLTPYLYAVRSVE